MRLHCNTKHISCLRSQKISFGFSKEKLVNNEQAGCYTHFFSHVYVIVVSQICSGSNFVDNFAHGPALRRKS